MDFTDLQAKEKSMVELSVIDGLNKFDSYVVAFRSDLEDEFDLDDLTSDEWRKINNRANSRWRKPIVKDYKRQLIDESMIKLKSRVAFSKDQAMQIALEVIDHCRNELDEGKTTKAAIDGIWEGLKQISKWEGYEDEAKLKLEVEKKISFVEDLLD